MINQVDNVCLVKIYNQKMLKMKNQEQQRIDRYISKTMGHLLVSGYNGCSIYNNDLKCQQFYQVQLTIIQNRYKN